MGKMKTYFPEKQMLLGVLQRHLFIFKDNTEELSSEEEIY